MIYEQAEKFGGTDSSLLSLLNNPKVQNLKPISKLLRNLVKHKNVSFIKYFILGSSILYNLFMVQDADSSLFDYESEINLVKTLTYSMETIEDSTENDSERDLSKVTDAFSVYDEKYM